jgi:hypothetical protein
MVMSALADMCGATTDVRLGQKRTCVRFILKIFRAHSYQFGQGLCTHFLKDPHAVHLDCFLGDPHYGCDLFV